MNQQLWQRPAIVFALACLFLNTSVAQKPDSVPPVGHGDLVSLSALPKDVAIRGKGTLQQLVVSGHYENFGVRDLTSLVVYTMADDTVAKVGATGMLTSIADGSTEVVASYAGKSTTIRVTVTEAARRQPINFTNEIVPIFSKLGCNSGACHGKSSGQNGFKLSLLGFEPQVDYDALAREARGRRLFPSAAERSLLLMKASGEVPHGGGVRLLRGSRDYELVARWIRGGMPFGQGSDPNVVGITIAPDHRLIARRSSQQITVTARYSDGTTRDVTADAEYHSNDPELLEVNHSGVVTTNHLVGEGAAMARYLGHVAVFRATIPLKPEALAREKGTSPSLTRRVTVANFIDEHIFAKLEQLAIPPSAICTDGEFIRRASIDICGTLPTAEQVKQFLADEDPKKREKLVDQLLQRPEYASYFALKWGDILRNRQRGLVKVGGGSGRTHGFHQWIRDGLEKNKPYDKFVRELLAARGAMYGKDSHPAVGWFNVFQTPQTMVDDTSQIFLGTRQAFEMVTGKAARDAMDLNLEPQETRDLYGKIATGRKGEDDWGMRCLTARRLVEAGVSFVTVVFNSWDDHSGVETNMTNRAPAFDRAVSALIEDLYARGLDKKVAVVVWGEFGRTPRMNKKKKGGPGRDHWSSSMSALVSGGGMKVGQVIGSTDARGERPKDRPLHPNDVWATIYRHLGIDWTKAFPNNAGRPIPILSRGEAISELL